MSYASAATTIPGNNMQANPKAPVSSQADKAPTGIGARPLSLKGESNYLSLLFTVATLLALFVGFQIRNEYYLSAEQGWGYALGIIGGTMMLLLLVYPIRKRLPFFSHLVSLKRWFQLHMVLGVVGPVCILYHCNFSLGSANSNIALLSMTLMVISGLVGRYLYSRIHFGLYGQKINLQELERHKQILAQKLTQDQRVKGIQLTADILDRLESHEISTLEPRALMIRLWRIITLGFTTRVIYRSLSRQLKQDEKASLSTNKAYKKVVGQYFSLVHSHIDRYLATLRKIAELSFYERLFSLWHLLHMPIFIMLVITGFVHVYAVHNY